MGTRQTPGIAAHEYEYRQNVQNDYKLSDFS